MDAVFLALTSRQDASSLSYLLSTMSRIPYENHTALNVAADYVLESSRLLRKSDVTLESNSREKWVIKVNKIIEEHLQMRSRLSSKVRTGSMLQM